MGGVGFSQALSSLAVFQGVYAYAHFGKYFEAVAVEF